MEKFTELGWKIHQAFKHTEKYRIYRKTTNPHIRRMLLRNFLRELDLYDRTFADMSFKNFRRTFAYETLSATRLMNSTLSR